MVRHNDANHENRDYNENGERDSVKRRLRFLRAGHLKIDRSAKRDHRRQKQTARRDPSSLVRRSHEQDSEAT